MAFFLDWLWSAMAPAFRAFLYLVSLTRPSADLLGRLKLVAARPALLNHITGNKSHDSGSF